MLITVPCLDLPGGVANYYRTLRPHLDSLKTYFEIGARPGQSGRLATFRRLLVDYWGFNRALTGQAIDLVHINPTMDSRSVLRDGLLMLIAKAHGRPVLVYFRGWNPAWEATIRERYRQLFGLVFNRADAIVVLAEEFRRTLRELGITAPISVETTLVDDSAFAASPDSARQLSPAAGAFDVLYLGRLDRGKGLSEAIEAFVRLRMIWPASTLTIAGEGPERSAVETEVRRRGLQGIAFLGHVDGSVKENAFRRSHAYLFTSMAEGMPNSVLEAMAFGLPVVTRPVGGLRDFFEDGRMGFATESVDPSVWAELLGRLARNPELRATMGQYNREFARSRFRASVVAARLMEIYAQVGRQAAAR